MTKLIYSLLIFVMLLSACEKFIEVDPPMDRLTSKTVFQDDWNAISAVTGLYANMMRNNLTISYIIPHYTGLYTDELDYKQNNILLQAVYKSTLNPKDAVTNTFWTNAYNFIYQANSIIIGLENSSTVSESVKKQLTGEALFLRAFWHFYLVNYYGDIPFVATTDYVINSQLARSATEVVYTQIENDLIKSKTLLESKYVATNAVSESTTRVRPNTYTSSALLTRVYLHQKKWNKATDEATHVIESGLYHLEDIDFIFNRNSKEVILQLETSSTSILNSYEATNFILTTVPSPMSNARSATISPSLYTIFDSTDQRRSKWFGVFRSQNVDYIYPFKYKSRTSAVLDEFTTPFRLAEMYLIRAESNAELNNLPAAIEDIDNIRTRAGVALLRDISPGISKEQLLIAISQERRKELFCEWGIRLLDILRSDRTEEIMTSVAAQKNSTWQPYMRLWPIPLNDIINNTKLIQNVGYN